MKREGEALTHTEKKKQRRIVVQDYRKGQELVKNRDFKANETFFKDVFEVGRRYKIMNPDRMRGTYGKLLYMLMDTADNNIEELLEFSCIKYAPLATSACDCSCRCSFTCLNSSSDRVFYSACMCEWVERP